MAGEEAKGFVIRDRRSRGDDAPEPSTQDTGRPKESLSDTRADSTARSSSQTQARSHTATDAVPPVSFASFVFSLGTSALMLLGEKLDPQANVPVNLSQAKEIIDILSMLEAKTQGNLNSEEKTVLENTLYALRIKYVDLAAKSPGKSEAR
jgi:hypothetical protein